MSSGRRWLRATATSFVLEFADGAVTVAPPVASAKVVSVNGLAVQFDGSASFSTTSTITGYAWDFGDGATASGQLASHTYAAGGTYTATLSVTDAVGGTASASAVVTVSGSTVNQSPIASFTVTVSGLTASVDGSGSSDPDGTIAAWAWTWGDSATSTGTTASHAYMTAGTYPITLTVKDTAGATNSATKSVTVSPTPINQAPVASFTFTVSGTTVAVDGSGSTDADGTIASWAWTWGDGATSTGKTATHTYGGAGTQTITLTVTDDKGAKGTATHTATTSTTTNNPPVASFTASGGATGTVTFDATGSTDSDGKVVTCTWDFGDGKRGTGLKVVHPYAQSGSVPVTLTVTDDKGATGQVTKTVTVTVSGGSGKVPNYDHIVWVWMENKGYDAVMGATSAAPWFRSFANSNALFTNSHGVAHPSYPNYLAGFSGSTQGATSDTVKNYGSPTTQYTAWKGAGYTLKGYRETASPDKHNPWNSFTNSTAANADFSTFPTDYTQLPKFCWVVPNLTDDMHNGSIAQGDTWMKTHLDALVTWAKTNNSLVVITWDEDDPNTSINRIATAMAGQGVTPGPYNDNVNHYSFLGMFCDSAGVTRFANATGKAAITAPFGGVATPVYPPLTAAFTSTVSGGQATFNAVGCADSNGTITSYAWDFGDGTTGSGPFITHTYAASKTYTVTLTVKDSAGATDTQTASVAAAGGSSGEPTGAGIVGYETLTGSKFSTRVNSAGTTNAVALPAGTYSMVDFSDGSQTITQGASAYGALISTKGLLGSGSGVTTLQMTANSSTKSGDVPPTCAGGTTCPTNNLYLVSMTGTNAKFDGISLLGTAQGHLYNGLRFEQVTSPTLSNAVIAGIPGAGSANPDETFHVNFQRAAGTATVKNVTIDGQNIGAAGVASNTSSAAFTVTGLTAKNLKYSAGWASWQQTGPMTFTNFKVSSSARAFGAERLAAAVTFVDPVWDTPTIGHDVTYTWESGFTGGSITFQFSSAAAWTAFTAARSTAKIIVLTNKVTGITASVKVYVAGALQPQANYVVFQ